MYRAGIIGLGFIGGGDQVSGDRLGQRVADLDGTHREALGRHPRVNLAAGSSRDAGRRERFAAATSAVTYADWREMLARERLDIVSVATYAPQHAEQVVTCAEAGVRAVYCEKPIATRLADAECMLAACRHSGSLLVVNHNRRYNPAYRDLAARIAGGEIGTLTSATLQWAYGRLGNVGTHMIDAVAMLTGRSVSAVSATLDLSDRPDCRGPDFHDPGGWAVMRMDTGHGETRKGNSLMALVNAPDYANGPAEVAVNGTLGRAVSGGSGVKLEWWNGRRESLDPPPGVTSMDQAVKEIVAWLDDGTPPGCSADESLATLEAIVACHASHARQAAWVSLPLQGKDREIEVHSG